MMTDDQVADGLLDKLREAQADSPTRDELIAALLEQVVDGEQIGYDAHRIFGQERGAWRKNWRDENPEWYDVYARHRALLERAGIEVPDPEPLKPRRRERSPEVPCSDCGRKRGHACWCSKAKK